MNGAESLIKTLVDSGVEVCFTNPGTSEMHFVAALDEVAGMRCVLGLFEGVVSGAADGYARMAGKPAATLLHLGPGLGNALANIHNARKGHVPIINIVGDHATYHLEYDAPLTSDIEGIAAPVSHWVHTATDPEDIAAAAATAVHEAGSNRVSTLVLPADVSWGENPRGPSAPTQPRELPLVDPVRLDEAVRALDAGPRAMILMGGGVVTAEMGDLAGRIAASTGARLCLETFPTRVARGAGRAVMERLPYLAEQAIEFLADVDQLILVGAATPVSFFAYPGVPSVLSADQCNVLTLATADQNRASALKDLLLLLGDKTANAKVYEQTEIPLPSGELNAMSLSQGLAGLLPAQAVVVDEGATTALPTFPLTAQAAPHDWLALTGGSIGFGLPCAVGAAIAAPERKVVCLEGDGSAMYTVQSLWTMARENLDITVVICNNAKYNILELEFARTGARGGKPGPKAADMLHIGNPDLDFVDIARGMGIEAVRATTAEEFCTAFATAMAEHGPRLIDAVVPPITLG